ncbi:UNVERIFIED_CONTAM: protein DMP3 [Sesamum radiatum]|uniref:Protein DMP3 n=1 Tax=Sesamum radiatum TaxID=300843 RepID=A0AAW2RWQ7_SESRA
MSDLRQRSSISKPLDSPPPPPLPPSPRPSQSMLSQALESSAHLANLLPTGTLLAFQLLTPVFTNNGSCDMVTRNMTLVLLFLLAFSCFLASFTDSFKASDGQVYYGLATSRGMWLFDYPTVPASAPSAELSKYRLRLVDFVHAVLSVLVFVAVALRDKNVVSCLYPSPGHEVQEVLDIVPMGIGLISSLLFVIFPTKRHGIGYPITRDR